MIKKFFHYICAVSACLLWACLLAFIYQQLFAFAYHINIFSISTYMVAANFWNEGGVLHSKDIIFICLLLMYIPLCLLAWKKLLKYKYLNLISGPLNKLANAGISGYRPPDINIKNLKIEEKKTLEQIVNERLEIEKKKQGDIQKKDVRKSIIEKIEKNKNK